MEVTIANPPFTTISAQITFVDSEGNTFEFGMSNMPFNFQTTNPYGTYYLYYPTFELTCEYTLNP